MWSKNINYKKGFCVLMCMVLCGCGTGNNTNTVNNTYQPENTYDNSLEEENPVTPVAMPTSTPIPTPTVTPTPESFEEKDVNQQTEKENGYAGTDEKYFFEYSFWGEEDISIVKVKGIDNEVTEIVVPEKLAGKTVVAIGDNAFANLVNVEKIQLPDTIISIGEEAFSNCTKLKSVNLPKELWIIYDHAFYGCESLESIEFGKKIEHIGKEVFKGCSSLKKAVFSESIKEIGRYTFSGCDMLELTIPNVSFDCESREIVITGILREAANGGVLEVLEIPAEIFGKPVTRIGENAFADSYECSKFVLAEGITQIERLAFSGNGMREISLPDTLRRIEDYAFSTCFGLKNIVLPDSVTYIGKYAFNECVMLEHITLSKNLVGISEKAFYKCSSLTEVETYDKLEYIDEKAFRESGIQYLWLRESVTIIAEDAFSYDNWNRCYHVTIFAPSGSMAESYANARGIDVIVLEEEEAEGRESYDVVDFGFYEQDNNSSNGKEAIEWIVLDEQDDKVLLLSTYVLDCQCFLDETETSYTWDDSFLRKWLNKEFLSQAFKKEEQKSIVLSQLAAPDNKAYGTDGGTATEDKVFLLSMEEAEAYFPKDEWLEAAGWYINGDRLALATEYAIAQGVMIFYDSNLCGTDMEDFNGCCSWWLRTPGEWHPDTAYVSSMGTICADGMIMDYYSVGVRPAIWVDVSALE